MANKVIEYLNSDRYDINEKSNKILISDKKTMKTVIEIHKFEIMEAMK